MSVQPPRGYYHRHGEFLEGDHPGGFYSDVGVCMAGYYTETGEFVEGHYNDSGEWVDGQPDRPEAEAGAADAAAAYPVAGAYADGTANADAVGVYIYTAEGAYANGSGAADEADTYTNGTGAAGDHFHGAGDAAGAYTHGLPVQGVDADDAAAAAGKGELAAEQAPAVGVEDGELTEMQL